MLYLLRLMIHPYLFYLFLLVFPFFFVYLFNLLFASVLQPATICLSYTSQMSRESRDSPKCIWSLLIFLLIFVFVHFIYLFTYFYIYLFIYIFIYLFYLCGKGYLYNRKIRVCQPERNRSRMTPCNQKYCKWLLVVHANQFQADCFNFFF